LPAGLALTRAVDGLFGSPDGGGPARHVAFRLRAGGAGEGDLGPWTLRVGEAALAIPAVPWQAVLPAGVELPAPPDPVAVDEVWWTPREALAGMVAPAAEWRSGRLAVVFSAGDEVATEPALPADGLLEIELRRDDQAEVLARAWPLDPAVRVVRVRVSRGGKVLLDRNVRRGR
jgi:hypothetical protein